MSATVTIGNDEVDQFLRPDFAIYLFHSEVSNHLVIADHDGGLFFALDERA